LVPLDIEPLDIEPLDIEPLDVEPLDMEPELLDWAKAGPAAIRAAAANMTSLDIGKLLLNGRNASALGDSPDGETSLAA
jgi:hypothetical protein